MRKLLSILLLLGLSLPFASTLLAAGVVPGSGLPMCCRRGGHHQCGMVAAGAAVEANGTSAGAPAERCPWRSVLGTAPHSDVFAFAGFHTVAGEAFARARLAAVLTRKGTPRESSHSSRGPPSLLPL